MATVAGRAMRVDNGRAIETTADRIEAVSDGVLIGGGCFWRSVSRAWRWWRENENGSYRPAHSGGTRPWTTTLPSIEPSIELPLSLGAVIWSSLKTGLRFLLSEV
jgi:hypothetical protein